MGKERLGERRVWEQGVWLYPVPWPVALAFRTVEKGAHSLPHPPTRAYLRSGCHTGIVLLCGPKASFRACFLSGIVQGDRERPQPVVFTHEHSHVKSWEVWQSECS